jgi:hypothetical protein
MLLYMCSVSLKLNMKTKVIKVNIFISKFIQYVIKLSSNGGSLLQRLKFKFRIEFYLMFRPDQSTFPCGCHVFTAD